ncbi:hypothetical protein LTR53_009621 [Teratosphaeriaceae sp. CCFEE 6253]|nr:hypothetical protein LTR53_009621 [Teratosphaeriaceae sp. CCFEE 6253]
MAQPWDYIAKIVSLGDSGSGKSSFGSRVVPVGPPASLEHNINNPVASKPTTKSPTDAAKKGRPAGEPQQKHMKLSLWDTAGQEQYKSITRSYFRGASGALLVFDITRRNTFNSVTNWLHDLRQIAEDDIVVILVGNKSDLTPSSIVTEGDSKNKRQVTRQEAEEWCRVNRVMQYVETSAKSGDNVERAFLEVAERIYQNIEAGRYDLNDRRSGVKGPGVGGGPNAGRTVTLSGKGAGGAKKAGAMGGCC